MTEVGAFEAKTHFSALLARAAAGEIITISNRGRPVARLVPMEPEADAEHDWRVWRRMRARAETLGGPSFDWLEWKAFRDEGRP